MQTKFLIIWDWDNTLMNTRSAVRAGMQDVATHYGLPDITDDDVLNVMTRHRGEFWQKHFGEKVPEVIEYYVAAYRTHEDLVSPFPETLDVLSYVQNQGIPQIVLSNKNEVALIEEVKYQNLEHYFDIIQGTKNALGKPDIAFVEPILKRFSAEKIILIGDGISDMLMAQNMGAISIMVHQSNKEWPHQYDCDTLSDVKTCLKMLLERE